MKISIIVAIDDKLGIGSISKTGLLWYIKADFAHFKTITLGHPIIMGRKTHESIGRTLPGRANIIITRDSGYVATGCLVVHSLAEAINLAKTKDDLEIFIIGGGEIFAQALSQNLVDRLYLTKVAGDYQADIFFPSYSQFSKIVSQEEKQEDQYKFTFYVLEKH